MSYRARRPHCTGARGRLALPWHPIAPRPAAGAMRSRPFNRERLPISRDENWKYANLRSLERVRFAPPATRRSGAIGPSALPARIPGYTRYTFVDGALRRRTVQPRRRATQAFPCAALACSVHPAAVRDADERFALLNEAFATEGAYVITRRRVGATLACVELRVRRLGGSPGGSFVSAPRDRRQVPVPASV